MVSPWETPLQGTWQQQSLRQILSRISETNNIGIFIDRRVDADQELDWGAEGKPSGEELHRLATSLGLGDVRIGDSLYLGPSSATSPLRTLVALRSEEITKTGDVKVRKAWLDPIEFQWQDLDTPREIVTQLVTPLGIKVSGEELIPHDHWRGLKLLGLNRVELLSLVLACWDLTFQLELKQKRIVLNKIPSQVQLKREYALTREQASQGSKVWPSQFPELQLQFRSNKLAAVGRLEDHERLAELLNPSAKPRTKPAEGGMAAVGLDRRRFTLQVKNATVRQLMQELQKSGIEFVYDRQALQERGIDLDQNLTLDVDGLTAEQFFEKVFGPLKLRARIKGLKVELTPR
ncbi:MAG: DsrE family protein [Planctomycetales bacterium]